MSSSTLTSRKPVTHSLKCWPSYFEDVRSGRKPFEVRKDDREPMFREGDWLVLNEFNRGLFTCHKAEVGSVPCTGACRHSHPRPLSPWRSL